MEADLVRFIILTYNWVGVYTASAAPAHRPQSCQTLEIISWEIILPYPTGSALLRSFATQRAITYGTPSCLAISLI